MKILVSRVYHSQHILHSSITYTMRDAMFQCANDDRT